MPIASAARSPTPKVNVDARGLVDLGGQFLKRRILDYVGAPYKAHNVLENADLRNGIKDYANWPTIPQLYIKGEFVGGCDIVREMFQSGELAETLASNGIAVKKAG